ncbi:APC family permease [Pseudarthrobacter sp. NPDC058196]|uniref:APC family permease n=1 Tax=Pseudarthrobacter sp. NPDC058196 TaxID=3346376 RepID=UPI0036DC3D9A
MPITESSPPQATTAVRQGQLHGNIGFLNLVFTILAYNGPMVVFLGFIPIVILLGNGVGTPAMIIVCGIVAVLFTAGLVAMGLRLPKPGGFYSIASAGLGKVVGLGAGYTAMVCYFAANLGAYALGGVAAESFLRDIGGPELPWWIYGLGMFAVTSFLGYMNIDFSAKVLTFFLALELLLMLAYNISVVSQGGAQGLGLDSFQPENIFSGSIGIAFLLGIGMYGGFEASVIFRDEVKRPEKTVPRATYTVVVVLTILYAFTAWSFINSYGPQAIMGVLSSNAAESSFESVRHFTGDFAYLAATMLLITSNFALSLASHNIVSRYLFNLSTDGVIVKSLSHVHRRHASPHKASVAVSAFVAVGILLFSGMEGGLAYARLAGIYAYAFAILMAVAALAITVFLAKDMTGGRRALWQAVATGISTVFLVIALVLATTNFELIIGTEGTLTWLILAVILGVIGTGMVTAAVYKKRRPDIYARIGRDDAGDIVPRIE